MPRFAYTAIDAHGTEKSGRLDAAAPREVTAILRRQGLFPTDVTPVPDATSGPVVTARPAVAGVDASAAGPKLAWPLPFTRIVKPRQLALFSRQMSTLLRAGMPLLRGLEVLARQERNASFRSILVGLAETIKSGGTLSDAMARHPGVFDRLFLNMIKAGEAGGVLDLVLDRLALFQEKSLRLKGKIAAAMAYPIIVMAVAVLILAGLLVYVVPKFKLIFTDLLKGAPLPPLTQAVLTVSDVVRSHLPVLLAGGVGLWIVLKVFAGTSGGARWLDTWVVHLPLFGEFFLKGIIARFGRTLGTLLSSGVPILSALLITRDTCANARVAGAITEVHDRVKEGAPVARPLEATAVFPPMVTSLIDVGEHTGQLPEMLGRVADIYKDEVDNAVAGLSSLIEPLLILFLAFVVGIIVIALFLPIIRIVQLLT